jgi:hypothetical protein
MFRGRQNFGFRGRSGYLSCHDISTRDWKRCEVRGGSVFTRHLRREVFNNVLDAIHQHCAFPKQSIAAAGLAAERASRNGEDLPILFERHPGGYQRAAFLRRFDDDHAERKAGQDTVAAGEILGQRRGAQREFAEHGATTFDDCVGEAAMLWRVGNVDTASQDRDGAAAGLERSAMRRAVDSARQATDDDEAMCGEFKAQPLGHPQTGFARRARADHRHAGSVDGFEQPARDEKRRGVGDVLQVGRVIGVGPSYQARTEPWQLAQLLLQRGEVVEARDSAGDVAPNSCGDDLFFGRFENPLGVAEPLEQ